MKTKNASSILYSEPLVRTLAFWLSLCALAVVPLVFTTSVYRTFSLPKFLALLTTSAGLVPLVGLSALAASERNSVWWRTPSSKHILLVFAYVLAMAGSTIFGAAPVASFFGSFESQMGLVTRLCFFVCFLGLLFGIGRSRARLMQTLWAMSLTGLVTATYAFVQFFGRDPLLPSSVYSFNLGSETVVRPIGTLGHSDYLGNFLLYTTPLTAGLALASNGRARRFAAVAAGVSTVAIAFSGTRGAWLGLIVGGVIFVATELPRRYAKSEVAWWRPNALRVAIACSIVVLSIWLIASNMASRSIAARARLLATEGFTGSGRTLLWRDSLKMVPAFAMTGCGPEGFRKAFLAYKSNELAHLAPDINNESSHNSYLDAAVTFGLPGAILYAAIIASTFSLLRGALQRAADRRWRVVITGLLSSFAAVATHNFFIFDQIPTGLYFFAFAALGCAVAWVENMGSRDFLDDGTLAEENRIKVKPNRSITTGRLVVAASFVALLISGLYLFSLGRADVEIRKAFGAANAGDLDQVTSLVNSARSSFDPTGDYDFMGARALTLCAERMRASKDSGRSSVEAIDMAIAHANKSLANTLTSDSNHLLLAYLALLKGDANGLAQQAAEALERDPYFPNARWLMAEAYLAKGEPEEAAREALLALDINPSLREAKSVLARVHGESEAGNPTAEQAIERARFLIEAGKAARAERVLLRAIGRSRGPCPECHRLLASIYEAANLDDNALGEWETFVREAPDRASKGQASVRIEALKKRRATDR